MSARPDLYLCNTYRHLLLALASCGAAPAAHPAPVIVYLEDVVPVPATIKASVARRCPNVRMHYTTDKAVQGAFERLGRWAPRVIRRNLSLHDGAVVTPARWNGDIAGLDVGAFETGYFSHAGFFVAKVLAARCRRVVLRESGLNNYAALPVSPLKALLRGLSGRHPFRQVWGEERWVERIEVTDPERLPERVRGKGIRRAFDNYMQALSPEEATDLAKLFLDGPVPHQLPGPSALLLTQPLSDLARSTGASHSDPFPAIVKVLRQKGFSVWHKPHPREGAYSLPDSSPLPARFPIEAWKYYGLPVFDLAVALHSVALEAERTTFSRHGIQLLGQADMRSLSPRQWADVLPRRLNNHLDSLPGFSGGDGPAFSE